MEIPMTENQVRYAVRLQQAAMKKEKLTYRGVHYLLVKPAPERPCISK